MALVREDPNKALENAAQWRALGGGSLARHCGAIAMISLGAEANAARELTAIGVQGDGFTEQDRAGALILAGELWLRQQKPELAEKAFDAALTIGGHSRRLGLGAARTAAMLEKWSRAVAALDPILSENPSDVEALTLRAAARRLGGDAEGAFADAQLATQYAPEIALAWFERGAAERALGRIGDARNSWLQASILDPIGPNGEPSGMAGELARRNLQLDAARD